MAKFYQDSSMNAAVIRGTVERDGVCVCVCVCVSIYVLSMYLYIHILRLHLLIHLGVTMYQCEFTPYIKRMTYTFTAALLEFYLIFLLLQV
jgi:hypothetical protein